jgi:replication initiation and membrane attachment protein DnaB
MSKHHAIGLYRQYKQIVGYKKLAIYRYFVKNSDMKSWRSEASKCKKLPSYIQSLSGILA